MRIDRSNQSNKYSGRPRRPTRSTSAGGRRRPAAHRARIAPGSNRKHAPMALATIGTPMTFTVRAARHAKKKATKGHQDTRPKKSSPSQRKRTPTEYPTVDPASVPAVMTVVSK